VLNLGKPLKGGFGGTFNPGSSSVWISGDVSQAKLYGFGGGRIDPEGSPESKQNHKNIFHE
jgi:hypothetical protein